MKLNLILLYIISSFLLLGCVSKQPAIDTVDALKENHAQAVETHKKLESMLIKKIFQLQKKLAAAQLRAVQAETITQIHVKSEVKIAGLIGTSQNQLEAAIEPQIENMINQLEEAKNSGKRQAEFEIAAQLSSTLAILGREENKLRSKIINKVNVVRNSAIADTKLKFSQVLFNYLSDFDSANIDTLVAQSLIVFFAAVDKNTSTTNDALTEVNRHIDINRLALKAFTDNVIPEGGLKNIAELAGFGDLNSVVYGKLQLLQNKVEGQINEAANKALVSTDKFLANVK
jgi:hypothetical protein